jgi:hypothetical protein
VGEVSLRHEVVSLEDLVNVGTVNTDGDTHDHVLWSLDNLAVNAEQVRPLERLETKVVVSEISVVDDGRVESVPVVHDNLVDVVGNHRCLLASFGVNPVVQIGDDSGERLLGLLV